MVANKITWTLDNFLVIKTTVWPYQNLVLGLKKNLKNYFGDYTSKVWDQEFLFQYKVKRVQSLRGIGKCFKMYVGELVR